MTYREAARKLSALGCHTIPRREYGPHSTWVRPTNNRGTVLPDHGGQDLRIGTFRAAVRQLGIDWAAFGGA